MGLSTKEGTFVMTYESITLVRLGKMVSFRAPILQSQRRWKETAGFCLYKGSESHFNVIINSHHGLPAQTSSSPLETFFSHSCRNITSAATSE